MSPLKKFIAYFSLCTVFVNTNIVTITTVVLGYGILFNEAFGQSQTPLLDELQTKHNLTDPTRNHTTDGLPQSVQDTLANPPPSRDQTGNIANVLANPTPSRDLQLTTRFPQTSSFSDQLDLALSLSTTHGQPTGTIVGNQLTNLDVEYARSGTRIFVRDPVTGKMVLKTVEGVPRVSGIDDVDMFSQELNNTNYNFEQNKANLHGDDQAIFDEGKLTHNSFKDPNMGQNAAARSYRVVTSSALQAKNTVISENAPWLQPSFNSMAATQDGSQWLAACNDSTVIANETYSYQTTREENCQDTSQSLLDFCQVERIFEPPLVVQESAGITITECGDGCIDVEMGSRADNSLAGNCQVFTKTATLGISSDYVVDSLTLTESAIDDHAIIQINNNTEWSFINGNAGSSGTLPSSNCELNTSWTPRHSGNLQQAFIDAQTSGIASIKFQTLVGGKGEAYLKFRIRFSDPSGNNFMGEFIQTPEGCYDALDPVQRAVNPLEGIYDNAGLLPPDIYTCSAQPRGISCPIGTIPVDNGISQTCYDAAQSTQSCAVGTYNPVTEKCETSGTYQCRLEDASNLNCNGNQVIAPEITLDGQSCIVTDTEHCSNSWSQTIPAYLVCADGFSDVGGVCTSDAITVLECSDGSEPLQVTIDSDTYYYCTDTESSPATIETQEWTCTDGRDFDAQLCDITRGSFQDTATCFFRDPDSEYQEPVSFCSFSGYEVLDEGDRGLSQAFLNKIPPFFAGDTGNKTWKVNLENYRCDPTFEEFYCRTDPDTLQEICMTWDELRNLPNQCQSLIDDSDCSEIRRTCSPGWYEEQSGRCMAYDVTFECVENHSVEYQVEETSNTCTGMLPCTGGECDFGNSESNTRFTEAMVAGSLIDNLQGDGECIDPNDPTTCQLFPGEFEYCSWELTGLGTDCCEEAKGVDVLSYIVLSRQLLRVNQLAAEGAFGTGIQGAHTTISQPITDAYQAASNWVGETLTTATDGMLGNEGIANGVNVISDGISSALTAVQQAAFELIYDIAPDALKDFLFDNATDYALDPANTELIMNEAISEALSTFFAIYTIYNLTKLALTLLTACDDNEIDMSVKLAQRQCFKVGDDYCSKELPVVSGLVPVCIQKRQNYCCYSSILARIVNKEAYAQLGIDPLPHGNKPATQQQIDESCPGLTPMQLTQVDFNTPSMQSSLQEWTGLLLEAGQIPTETSEEFLTGPAQTEERTDCPLEEVPVLSCFIDSNGDQKCEQARDPLTGDLLYTTQPSDCGGKVTAGQIINAYDRVTVSERYQDPNSFLEDAQDRTEESEMLIRGIAGNVDCTQTPQPVVCRFGFDPTNQWLKGEKST